MERLFVLTATARGFPGWVRYGLTTLLASAALLVRFALFGLDPGRPFLTFYPVVVVVGVAFNRGTAFYATALGALLGTWFFVPPVWSLGITAGHDLAGLLFFVASSLFVAVLLEALHLTYAEAIRSRRQLAEDADRLAAAAAEREMLLREAVHRTRNDLQRLGAILQLQAAAATEPAVLHALAEAVGRIQALSRVNRRLERYWTAEAVLDSRDFLEGLCHDLREAAIGLRPVALHVEAEAQPLAVARAVPLGLIVNELVTNALKYAFPEDRPGAIWVCFRQMGDDLVLTVEDDGVGHDPAAPARGTGLGVRLVRALAAQLGGRVAVGPGRAGDGTPEQNGGGPGTGWTLRFPAAAS